MKVRVQIDKKRGLRVDGSLLFRVDPIQRLIKAGKKSVRFLSGVVASESKWFQYTILSAFFQGNIIQLNV